jgi:DNA-binding NarL/FixJ family response regulator
MCTWYVSADPQGGPHVGQETQVIRILIADDHPVIREGLRAGLSDEEDLVVCGCAEDGESAVEMTRALEPDVVLMDLTMPRLDGLTALRTILVENPEMRVLVVSAYGDRAHVRAALDAGARGYVLKGTTTEDLVVALRAVHRGETVLSPDELTGLAL